jgi:GTP-binding protein EngB required for normal cell division
MIHIPNIKQDVTKTNPCGSLLSLREMEDLTGFGFKRIKKKMGHLKPQKVEGTIHYYETKEVLPLLYSNVEKTKNLFQLDQERAKLASKQAERTEIIIQQMRGDLVETASLSEALSKTFGHVRSKMLSLPSKIAMLLAGLTPNEIEMVLKDNLYGHRSNGKSQTEKNQILQRSDMSAFLVKPLRIQ